MELKPFNLKKTVIPAAMLFSPIFSPRKNNELSERKIISLQTKRTRTEYLEYDGFELDCDIDFKLYSLIISKLSIGEDYKEKKLFPENRESITLYKNEIFDILNTSRGERYKNTFKSYIERIDRFKDCKVRIYSRHKMSNGSIQTYFDHSFNLIEDYEVDSEIKSIKINLDYNFNSIILSYFPRTIVSLNDFGKIKTQYTKSLYLMFLTLKFSTSPYYYVRLENIRERICRNINKKNHIATIKKTLDSLITLNIIEKYEIQKNYDPLFSCVKIYNINNQ